MAARLVSRSQNVDWQVWQNEHGNYDDDAVTRMILLDIRDELQRLNALLHCNNFVRIPRVLDGIAKNTKKPVRKKKAK